MSRLLLAAKILGERACARGVLLSVAESCTGGVVSAALTDCAGASSWFCRGVVCYDNTAKMELLGVSPRLLAEYGAVSEQTAAAMCLGAGEYSLALTGIAGPGGGSDKKPVGMVCFAWRLAAMTKTETKYFVGGRQAVRTMAAIHAVSVMADLLQD